MFSLPEKITIWNPISNDGFGNISWELPVIVSARIAFKTTKITDKEGNDYLSKAVCYTKSELITEDSIVYFGESQEAEPIDDADDVVMLSQTPSGIDLKKAWF